MARTRSRGGRGSGAGAGGAGAGGGGPRERKPGEDEPREQVLGEQPPVADAPKWDPQEVVFLKRREGTGLHKREMLRMVRDLKEFDDDAESDAGLRAWHKGDRLLELYNGIPELAFDVEEFVPWAAATFDYSTDEVYEYLRIRANVPTKEKAKKIGRSKLRKGHTLCELLQLETFDALAKRDLLLPDGTTCRWPTATRNQLEAALRLLRRLPPPRPAGSASRALHAEAARKNEAFKLARAEDADLHGVKAKWTARDNEVFFECNALNRTQLAALMRFLARVEQD